MKKRPVPYPAFQEVNDRCCPISSPDFPVVCLSAKRGWTEPDYHFLGTDPRRVAVLGNTVPSNGKSVSDNRGVFHAN